MGGVVYGWHAVVMVVVSLLSLCPARGWAGVRSGVCGHTGRSPGYGRAVGVRYRVPTPYPLALLPRWVLT